MTQLVELQEGYENFQAHGIKLYAISYDDQEVLRAFAESYGIAYPLLSDLDSAVIKQYRILNTEIEPGDAVLYGIPFPGTYITDENGIVVHKFFHDTYKRREGPELLIDAALGRVVLDDAAPAASETDDEGIKVTAALHGGAIKQGAQREVVVRFDLPDSLHIYGEPVPDGMSPTTVTVTGPAGLAVEEAIVPPTEQLRLDSLDMELPVWSGQVDIRVPIYALSALQSECRPLDRDSIDIQVDVRYQACNDDVCLLPKSESFTITAPMETIHVQNIDLHTGHGQKEATFDGTPHLRRLLFRKIRQSPLGFIRYIFKERALRRAAKKRSKKRQHLP